MTIADAVGETRKYWPAPHWEYPDAYFAATEGYCPENVGAIFPSFTEAQTTCDRLNMLAVLESDAIREPSERMVTAGYGHSDPADTWRAMIDELIAEVREAGNDA